MIRNVEAARIHGITAGGTTGHEHTQRYRDDTVAFTAVRDRIAGEVTFLLTNNEDVSVPLPYPRRELPAPEDLGALKGIDPKRFKLRKK